jgi:alpha-L-rhamnosidase
MHPYPGGGLTYATVELHSMYGTIRSAWTQENDRFDWKVIIPTNTTATIYVPAKDVSHVKESEQPLEKVNGVTFTRMENGFAMFCLASGTYNFSSHLE